MANAAYKAPNITKSGKQALKNPSHKLKLKVKTSFASGFKLSIYSNIWFLILQYDFKEKAQRCDWQLPVDQLVEQQALIEVLKLALPHPAAPLQLHVAVHSGVVGPSALLTPVVPLGCSINAPKIILYFNVRFFSPRCMKLTFFVFV